MGRSPLFWKAAVARADRMLCRLLCAGMLIWGGAPVAQASPVISQSLRFSVSGMDSSVNLDWASWSEEVSLRFTSWTGLAPAFRREVPIRILLSEQADTPEGVVYIESVRDRGELHQRMLLINPAQIADETALYGLVQLLLDRHLVQQPGAQTHAGAFRIAPGWLTVGVAGNLFGTLRSVMQRTAVHALASGADPDIARLVQYQRWEDVRGEEEVWCTLLVAWLQAHDRSSRMVPVLLRHLEARPSLPLQDLLAWTGHADVRDAQIVFHLWLAEQTQIIGEPGGWTRRDLDRLKERLIARGDRFDALGIPGVPVEVRAHQLIERRSEPWVEAVARQLMFDVHGLGLGKAEEFRAVTTAYADYFSWVQRAAMDRRRIKLGGYVSEKKLMRYYREARAALLKLESLLPAEP